MNPKEKAKELFDKMFANCNMTIAGAGSIWKPLCKKQCLIVVENEYYSLREQLFNLRSCGIIESEQTYLSRIQKLIDEEKQVKTEIEKV